MQVSEEELDLCELIQQVGYDLVMVTMKYENNPVILFNDFSTRDRFNLLNVFNIFTPGSDNSNPHV